MSTVLTIVVGLAPAYVFARYTFPGRVAAPRADDGTVRPADRRDGCGDAGPRARLVQPHDLGGADRPRDLQPGGRRPRRRRHVGAAAPRHGARRGDARSISRLRCSATSRSRCCVRRCWPPARSCSSSRSRRTGSSACSPRRAPARSRSRCGATPPSSAVSGTAAVLALIQLLVLGAGRHLGEPPAAPPQRSLAIDDTPSRRSPRTTAERRLVATVVGRTALVTVTPLGALVVRSLSTPTGWSTAAWTELGRVEVRPGISLGVDSRRRDPELAEHGVLGDRHRRHDRRRRRASPSRIGSPRPPARHRLDAADRHLGRHHRLRHAHHVRHRPRRLARLVGGSYRSARRSSPCRSSCATASACCDRSIRR